MPGELYLCENAELMYDSLHKPGYSPVRAGSICLHMGLVFCERRGDLRAFFVEGQFRFWPREWHPSSRMRKL